MERLKELRTAQKLTQQQMADYLGVDRTTYVKYETDKSEPTFDTLQKLADYFGVTGGFLMGRDTRKARRHDGRRAERIFGRTKKP